MSDPVRFVADHTVLAAVPFLPELSLHISAEVIGLWELAEQIRGEVNSAPPFWAFPWAGGQGLARYVLDTADLVAGKRVLDLASGSGLVAIAAGLAGAAEVTANEIDPFADAAITLNAQANGVAVKLLSGDLFGRDFSEIGADVVLAGDVFYSREMARRMLAFMRQAHRYGAEVLVGDPGRAYLRHEAFVRVATYEVPVIRELEDADVKQTTVWRLLR